PIGAGIHPERTANGAGNAVIEMKSANTGLQSCSGYPFVRRGRTCADTRGRDRFHFPEATSRKADDETLYAAVAHQEVRADTDHGKRYFLRHCPEEHGQVFLVGRLVQRVRQTAGPE